MVDTFPRDAALELGRMSFRDQQVLDGTDEDWRGNLSHGFNHLRNWNKDQTVVNNHSIWRLIIHSSNKSLKRRNKQIVDPQHPLMYLPQ